MEAFFDRGDFSVPLIEKLMSHSLTEHGQPMPVHEQQRLQGLSTYRHFFDNDGFTRYVIMAEFRGSLHFGDTIYYIHTCRHFAKYSVAPA